MSDDAASAHFDPEQHEFSADLRARIAETWGISAEEFLRRISEGTMHEVDPSLPPYV